ncbi:uncharacterized protein LOC124167669 [Ischnura elegans]|uniref:uncharacterized protein LOC124167669 n=1 Tax=Ischnura elegans TaxID=197161 RepID=UPI001ED8B5EE|nr:uncharacterized protein LOC124167669 [Ischnura elegans]
MALQRTFNPKVPKTIEEPVARACLPYVSSVSGKISRILRRFNIASIHLPPPKLRDYLVRAKDPVGLKTPGVYRVPCECGEAHIGETGRTIETRLKEHKRHLRLGQPEKSAIAERSIQHDHVIQFDDAEILMRSTKYWDRVVKEAIEIRLDHKNFNRDAGYTISNTWKPVLSALKSQRINGLAAKRPVLNQSRDT